MCTTVVELEEVVDPVAGCIGFEQSRGDQQVRQFGCAVELLDAVARDVAIGQEAVAPADRAGPQADSGEPLLDGQQVELRVVVEAVVEPSPGHQRTPTGSPAGAADARGVGPDMSTGDRPAVGRSG